MIELERSALGGRAAETALSQDVVDAVHERGGVRFTSNIVGPLFFWVDILCILVAAPLALLVYSLSFGQRLESSVHLFALVVMVVCYPLLRTSKHAYEKTMWSDLDDEGDAIFYAAVATFLTAAMVWQFGMIVEYSRGLSVLYLLSLIACLLVSRPLLRRYLAALSRKGVISQRIAFYGADIGSLSVIERLLASVTVPNIKFVGVADDRPEVLPPAHLSWIGGFEELTALARNNLVDQIFIVVPDLNKARLHDIVEELSGVSVDVSLIPPQAVNYFPDYRINLLGSIPVLTLWQRPFRDINQFVKRGEDLLIGLFALILTAPILAVTALLIRMTSSGPVFFVQPRLGFNNEIINVRKFRSMYAGRSDLTGSQTTVVNDDRVTPVGRVIRKLSIDELPQLFNVLKGDMSLVGPRPHATHMKVGETFYVDAVRGYAGRHRVKPGITGLAQVRGLRGEIRTIERARRRVELDKQYIDEWSVWLDIKIMLATLRAVFFDSDAY